MKYDLIISAAPKDIYKIPYCLESTRKHFSIQPENTFIVCPYRTRIDGTIHIGDEHATPFNKNEINFHRQGWIFQQLIKLFPSFVKNDYYFVTDSDVIFTKPLTIEPAFWISDREQHHQPYFNFMQHFDIQKVVDHTFINDFMLFDRDICQEMTGPPLDFFEKMNKLLSDDCFPAEFEMYGNYVEKKYPGVYKKIQQKVETNGVFYPNNWEQEDIERLIEKHKHTDIDLFTIHTWT